ncbi:MAG: hypothetical protein COV48_16775 [Elusimicrobia bacterium CG11_big_fil_rev_8_21_14_0_20_64_6]|nr:MAG: hypothetical protein COV48_16775 [Elusimicrobia bacterium CG11_big_fil_rev_8_21_14_0_20_64_6]
MPPSPPELASLQRSLREILTAPQGVRAAVRETPAALRWIAEAAPIDAPTRLSVYGDGYFLRLLEALASDYPAVRRTLGEDDFRVLAANYLEANPSRSPTLADLGEAFPRFVSSHPLGRKYPFLGDLSQLERDAMTRLFAARLPALDPETIGRIPAEDWPRARLILDPTVLLLKLAWPVERLWRRRELPPADGGKVLRRARAQWLLVFRDETWVRVAEISRPEWAALRRIKEGARLGGAFARASKSLGKTSAAEVQRWLSAWVGGGLIKGIECPKKRTTASRAAPQQPAHGKSNAKKDPMKNVGRR